MQVKLFEVRDRNTFIPVVGIAINEPANEAERYLMRRSGYALEEIGGNGHGCLLFGKLIGGRFYYDPYDNTEPTRTIRVAHHYVHEHWNELETGAVIDVEFIAGETSAPKQSEADSFPI